MSLAPGSRIGPFQVTALIGSGGMGQVYRATDTSLGRDVAIKILPADVAADAERLARFRREAQLLAALNHPGIAAIHGLEERDGIPFLVLELVEGEDLAQRLTRGPIPPDEAIEIARRIAEALEEAHDKGIIHRDLKPANVKLAPDGRVKVLDFGLAKALTASVGPGPAAEMSQSPTLVHVSGTKAGLILGTAAYMAPEQARGRAVDRRADIWAFGVVLWEMLAGRQLFAGETVSDIIAAVLTREPEWAALPAGTPPHVVRLLRRCLERDPKRRLQAIGEARIELERGAGDAGPIAPDPTAPAAGRIPWKLAAGLIVLAAAIGAAAMLAFRAAPSSPAATSRRVAFSVNPPPGSHFIGGLELSRDGRSLAFVARDAAGQTALWVRGLDTVEPRRIDGTDGAHYPFWSPDGRQLGFFANGEVKVVDLLGGAVRTVAPTNYTPDARGGSWGADDIIVFAPSFSGGLMQVKASGGGTPTPATQLDTARKDGTHRWPCFLPDGRRFLFFASKATGTEPGELRLGTVGAPVTQTLTASQARGIASSPDGVLYLLGKNLVAQGFDSSRQALVGDPAPLGIELEGSIGISGFRFLSASAGTLAYRQVQWSTSHIVWADRQGREISVAVEDGGWHHLPRLSPDGRRIAVAHFSPGQGDGDVHVHDLERHLDTRVTFDESDDEGAVWSRDGRTLVLTTASNATSDIYVADPTRPGERRLRFRGERLTLAPETLPDGGLVLVISDASGRPDLYRLPPGEGSSPIPIVVSPFSEYAPSVSSDGHWLAYVGDSTGRDEVYARSLDSGEEWRVSKEGGLAPAWRKDGKELFYVDARGFITAVPTTLGSRLSLGTPQQLFAALLEEATGRQYDVSPDGQRFLLNRRKETDDKPIVVMTGLPEDLSRLADRSADKGR